jgi:hypothetical protein
MEKPETKIVELPLDRFGVGNPREATNAEAKDMNAQSAANTV